MSKFDVVAVAVLGVVALTALAGAHLFGAGWTDPLIVVWVGTALASLAPMHRDVRGLDDHYRFSDKDFPMRSRDWLLSAILAYPLAWVMYLYSRWLVHRYETGTIGEDGGSPSTAGQIGP